MCVCVCVCVCGRYALSTPLPITHPSGDAFKSNAFSKVGAILADFPTPITAASQLKGTKGVGASSMAKVWKGARGGGGARKRVVPLRHFHANTF
jgi:hypothetical protein